MDSVGMTCLMGFCLSSSLALQSTQNLLDLNAPGTLALMLQFLQKMNAQTTHFLRFDVSLKAVEHFLHLLLLSNTLAR